MDQIMFQQQPVSYQHTKQETGTMSLSDRFTLIKLQKRDISNDKSVNRKWNREKLQKNFRVGQGIESRSVFSRIGAVTSSTFSINHKNLNGCMNTEEIQDFGSIIDAGNKKMNGNRSNHVDFNSNLFVIHEEDGTYSELKLEFEEDNKEKVEVLAPNFQLDPATKRISRILPKKRKFTVDINELDRELEEYMIAAPRKTPPIPPPDIKNNIDDDLIDLIDFDIDFMDMDA